MKTLAVVVISIACGGLWVALGWGPFWVGLVLAALGFQLLGVFGEVVKLVGKVSDAADAVLDIRATVCDNQQSTTKRSAV